MNAQTISEIEVTSETDFLRKYRNKIINGSFRKGKFVFNMHGERNPEFTGSVAKDLIHLKYDARYSSDDRKNFVVSELHKSRRAY